MPSPFQIPDSITKEPSGKPPEKRGTKSDASDFSIEDLLLAKSLLPRKRNDAAHKAIRLLTAGRLTVLRKDGELVVAKCKGVHGKVYDLGFDPRNRQWRCTCQAKTDCSHLRALWAVVVEGE